MPWTRSARRFRAPAERGSRNLVGAYDRVAAAVGIKPAEVRTAYLAVTNNRPLNLTRDLYDAVQMLRMTEVAFEQWIRQRVVMANRLHPHHNGRSRFVYYHVHRSEHSEEGWPDDTLIDRKLNRLYFWENKREDYEPAPVQEALLEDLMEVALASNGAVRCLGVMRPSSQTAIKQILELP